MDLEFNEKFWIVIVFIFLGTLFSLFKYPIFSRDSEVAGEVIGTYQVPVEGGSKKYIRVLLEDGQEVNSRVNKIYQYVEGEKVILLKRAGAKTEYEYQQVTE